MIIDKISNVSIYKDIIPDYAVEFMNNLTAEIKTGRYVLSDSDYANVEVYTTKMVDVAKFEAHKDYVDIQILLSGEERIYYTATDNLNIDMPYNKEKDIVFFSDSINSGDYVTLDGANFVMIFPHEAHAPQVCVSNSCEVKKVVLKLKL